MNVHAYIVLSVGTSSYLNVETEPKTKWCGDGESEKEWEKEYQYQPL